MTVFLLTLILLALGITGMSIAVIFSKNGRFPDSSIGRNKNMKDRGIMCPNQEERTLLKKNKNEHCCDCRQT
ncbi:MAG: hypothetical protein WC262_02940 [Bacteroidales bacterium]|jgi:hypothetical protein